MSFFLSGIGTREIMVARAHIQAFTFHGAGKLNTRETCTCVGLRGLCFKTGAPIQMFTLSWRCQRTTIMPIHSLCAVDKSLHTVEGWMPSRGYHLCPLARVPTKVGHESCRQRQKRVPETP